MEIFGRTYISVGDPFNPDYIKVLGKNDSVPLGESTVMASFAMGANTMYYKYLAIGGGNTTDFTDPANPPENSSIITKYFSIPGVENRLFSEFYRISLSRSTFVDNNNQPINEPTNKVLLLWQIPNGSAIGTWRELGIFAGDASEDLNSGVLVHYQTIRDQPKSPSLFGERAINFHWLLEF